MGQTGVHTLRQHFNNTPSVPPWIPSLTSLFIISVLFVETISYIVGAAFILDLMEVNLLADY